MARCVSQTLISFTTTSAAKINPYSSLFSSEKPPRNLLRFLSLRTKYAVHVVGPNDNTTNNNTDAADVEAMAVQKIEDAIHRIVVRKSVPDWLPFVPGGSYWVPPKRHLDGLPQLIHTIANALTEEEYLSLINVREAETLSSKTTEAEAYEDEESEDEGGAN